jgi:hypothetical protein
MRLRYGWLVMRFGQGCFTTKPARAGVRASRGCVRCLKRPSDEARIRLGLLFPPEAGLGRGEIVSLEQTKPWPESCPSVSTACADGGYQPCLGVLGVPLITVRDINVVGNKELSCAENQGLQHGGKSKDGNIYAFKCKYFKLSFLMCLV